MAYTIYTVKKGDRWDSIAEKAYGNISYMSFVIEQNHEIPLDIPLTEGITLRLPVIDVVKSDEELLPPWKKSI